MGAKQILVDFSGWTSCHGVPHIGAASNWCLRMFWTLIFLASASMFGYQLYLLIQKFTSYPVSVETELKFEELTFPAVTVCNLNPYKYSAVQANSKHTKDIIRLIQAYEAAIVANASGVDPMWGFNDLNDTIAIQSKAKDDLVYVMARLHDTHPDVASAISFSQSDFIINCAYNTLACKDSDFTLHEDPVYGACYTFNANKTYTSNRAGPIYGLRLLLKSNQSEYLPLVESAGCRIAVHPQEEEPFADAFGYNAATGFTTSFGVSYVKNERLSLPYGNCTHDKKDHPYFYEGHYTVEGCFRSCYQLMATAQCNCSDPRYALLPTNDTVCDYETSLVPASCIQKFASPSNENGFDSISSCSCPQPCSEDDYSVTVSNALWPSEMFTPQQCLSGSYVGSWTDTNSCRSWYGNNTLLIEIYFERMNYQELNELPAYGTVSLISDLGGQLGLWMGFSAITAVEFLSLVALLCIYCFASKAGNRPNPTPVQPFDGNTANEMSNMGAPPPKGSPPPAYGNMSAENFYNNNTNPDTMMPPKPVYN